MNILTVLSNEDTNYLFKIFKNEGFEIRFVGGCVRDALLGKKSDDIDFSTNARPDDMHRIFKKYKVHYFDSGLKHGTITAVFNKVCYEITTLRYDKNCDGRHADVEYTEDWQLDAARRDFTFNALYCDENGKIYDYFNGIDDIKNRKLQFIGDCNQRIEEDYLRILRAFRFNNRYCDGKFDDKIINAFTIYSEKIQNLSGERIQQEMIKLFSEIKIENIPMLQIFNETKIAKYVFGIDNFVNFTVLNRLIQLKVDNIWSRFGILLRKNNIDAKWIADRWSLSKNNFKFLCKIKEIVVPKDFFSMENKYFFLNYSLLDSFLFMCLDGGIFDESKFHEIRRTWHSKQELILPINSSDVIAIGCVGKEIGDAIDLARKKWLDTNCEIDKDSLIEFLKEKIKK